MASALTCEVGNLTFSNPLVVGAGVCKTREDVLEAIRTPAAGVELGSITPEESTGNGGNNFHAAFRNGVLLFTLNSLGMPNPGRAAVSRWARDVIIAAHDAGKLIGVNVAGDNDRQLASMVEWAIRLGFDWVTINGGCPNRYKADGTPESILSFNLDAISELTCTLKRELGNHPGVEVWWKPSPINDTLGMRPRMTRLVAECPLITGIVHNNTVPHAYAINPNGRPYISVASGLAGMGGPAVKPRALGDILATAQMCGNRFNNIGAGGITYGEDIGDFRRTGAHLVMATSAWWAAEGDWRVYGDILEQYCTQEGIEF